MVDSGPVVQENPRLLGVRGKCVSYFTLRWLSKKCTLWRGRVSALIGSSEMPYTSLICTLSVNIPRCLPIETSAALGIIILFLDFLGFKEIVERTNRLRRGFACPSRLI
jgi:hypothetical protein